MKNLTCPILLVLASSVAGISGCAPSQGLVSRDQAEDPYPWCADQRREAIERMPSSASTPEDLRKRDRYIDAHVAKSCQTFSHPTR